jgi:hypothetical protein
VTSRQAAPRSGTSQGSTRSYDHRQRQEAARLQRGHPAWLVLYGPHSRQFWSFPAFAAPPGTIVTAATPTDLVVLMRQAEISAGARLPPAPQPAATTRERPPP